MTSETVTNIEKITEIFFDEIRSINKEKIYIALVGGRSIIDFYNRIVERCDNLEKKHWQKIIFCYADERLNPKSSEELNNTIVSKIFFRLIDKNLITEDQLIKVDIMSKDPVEDYNQKIPKVDIIILGSGEDGHVASLFPNHPSINNEEYKYILVENSPKPPSKRISMSRKMIQDSICLIFFVGEQKREAFNNFQESEVEIEQCPAKIVLQSKKYHIFSNLT